MGAWRWLLGRRLGAHRGCRPPNQHRGVPLATWAQLLARIYEAFPLLCAFCGAQMSIVAFLTDPTSVREILAPLGEPIRPPVTAPARAPPLWDIPGAGHGDFDPYVQPAPAYEFDQRIAW
jgi:hypothetical protein